MTETDNITFLIKLVSSIMSELGCGLEYAISPTDESGCCEVAMLGLDKKLCLYLRDTTVHLRVVPLTFDNAYLGMLYRVSVSRIPKGAPGDYRNVDLSDPDSTLKLAELINNTITNIQSPGQ